MTTTLNEDAAAYLVYLERKLKAGELSASEALQKAFSLGATRGQIAGIEKAKDIYMAPKP
jgi:hypothetical protein